MLSKPGAVHYYHFCIFTEQQTQKLKEETESLKMPRGFSQNHQLHRML